MFGSVVVGLGRVGSVRVRDMLEPLPGSPKEQLSVKGFISRRALGDHLGVAQISLEEAVSREDVQVAFICTENLLHEESVRAFLAAGKHVCVEFPMTMNPKGAEELFDLAQEKGLIVHVEHIELLTANYKQLKREVAGKQLQGGTLHFTGGALTSGYGFPSFSGIARLTWLVDLFGELSVSSATMEERPEGNYSKMTVQLQTLTNRPLTWIEERQSGLPRNKKIKFCFDTGTMTQIPPAPTEKVGLFMQDLELFSRKLQGQFSAVELQKERRRTLHCLKLAERIQQLCQC